MMELKIYNPTEDGFVKAIEWNHEEIKAEVSEKMKEYANVVYTENQIKEAKADRAKLNKFVGALESKRKEIKKQCMQPYDDFEKKMKEITSVVNEAIRTIDDQVKGFEEQQKEEKREQISEVFEAADLPEYVSLEQIWSEKWLNKSVSLTSIKAEMETAKADIAEAVQMLQNLPEFGFEAVEVYKSTLNVTKAVNEAQRMSQIAKMKAEAEEKRKQEEARKAAEADDIADIQKKIEESAQPAVERMWISFSAYVTTEEAMALKEFFQARNIEFKKV